MPRCPVCNSPMVLRVARRGPYAGKQFYGCSKYPACKGILNLDENSSPGTATESTKKQFVFPHHMIARSKFQGYQAIFFENAAVSSGCLETLMANDIDEAYLMSFAQWRLDFPSIEHPV